MTDSSDIDWSQPIEARPFHWRSPRALVRLPTPPPVYHLAEVRREQVRRAKLLLEAAGARPMSPRSIAPTVARLAALVPGMRYRAGVFVVSKLAPAAPFLLADPAEPTAKGGRPSTWTDDRLVALATYHAEVLAEGPQSDNTAMTTVRKRWLRAQKADIAAHIERGAHADAEALKHETVPSVKTLIGYLARGRALLAATGAPEDSV